MSAPEHKDCSLLPGLFGIFVQGILFAVSVGVLVLKKKREEHLDPLGARTWTVFMLDSSKQLIGAAWVHVLNLVCATVFGEKMEGDGCQWYWCNIMVDTTLGVAINFWLLRFFTAFMENLTGSTGQFKSGDYKDEQGKMIYSRYASQLGVWLVCVSVMKLAMVLLMSTFHSQMNAVSSSILSVFPDPKIELIFVMVLTPMTMNAIQLWVQDTFLKGAKKEDFEGLGAVQLANEYKD